MKKNGKLWAAVLLVLLLVAVVLLLIRCRAQQEQPETLESVPASGPSAAVSSTGSIPGTSSSAQGTTAPASSSAVSAPSSQPVTEPSQGETKPATQTTKPATQATKPSQSGAQQTKPATTGPVSTCSHVFNEWKYEEYTYIIPEDPDNPHDGYEDAVITSHRKVRTCTKCGYKEHGNTLDHSCKKGSSNHTVTTVKESTCTTPAVMRSTCKICGWYVEYDGKKGSHTIKTETRHLTDYGAYTNELDLVTQTCTSCGATDSSYTYGEGFADYNRYHNAIVINQGTAFAGRTPSGSDFLEHPTWQTVIRDYKYDSEGYVKQFTVYWYSTAGTRYSYVVDCTPEHLASWFAEYGLTGGEGCKYQFMISGGIIVPYKISWTN